jgi:hypothetical protein
MARFQKNCKLKSCLKEFESDSRNEAYCSDNCREAGKKKANARVKRKRGYTKDAPNRRAQSMSRREFRANGAAEMCIGICQMCADFHFVKDLEFHHRDGNPFNNDPDNRASLCKKCHPKADAAWRKAKEEGKPIEEVRKWVLSLSGVINDNGKVEKWAPYVREFDPNRVEIKIPLSAVV